VLYCEKEEGARWLGSGADDGAGSGQGRARLNGAGLGASCESRGKRGERQRAGEREGERRTGWVAAAWGRGRRRRLGV
jgi:hypothetical protein